MNDRSKTSPGCRALMTATITGVVLAVAANAEGGTSYVTDGNNIDLTTVDDDYDGTLGSMASVTLDVPDSFTLSDVDVILDMSHTWVGDLVVKLQSPVGTVIPLFSRVGFDEPADDGMGGKGDSSNLVIGNTYEIADNGTDSSETIGAGTPGGDPIPSFVLWSSGFMSEFGLTTLNGENAAGIWTLYVGDSAAGDNGILDGFTLVLEEKVALDGACCFDDGSCTVGSEDDCIAGGGIYQGDNTFCGTGTFCPQPGACCFDDGSCTFGFETDCIAGGGTYQGDGVTCGDANCPQPGACCFDDGSCTFGFETDCIAGGGTYQGDGVTCGDANCPQPGACCFDDGSCTFGFETDCIAGGGTYQGDGVTCGDANCPQPGACCFDDGSCTFGFETDCIAGGGTYQGDGVTCGDADCSVGKNIYLTDGNGLDLIPVDDLYDGTLGSMASLTLNVPDCIEITDIDVIVDIAHTWAGDLVVKLRAPSGALVELVSRPGFVEPADDGTGCCGEDSDLVFGNTYEIDDAAAVPSEDMGIGGEKPIASFSLFSSGFLGDHGLTTLVGQQARGDWTLYVGDSAAGDNGVLDGFTMEIGGSVIPCDSQNGDVTCDGCVSFADILSVLGTWGTGSPAGDANCDGLVTFADILLVLGTWGEGCP